MRILIADDHALFRDGLRSLLGTQSHEVVAEARNGREAIELTKKLVYSENAVQRMLDYWSIRCGDKAR